MLRERIKEELKSLERRRSLYIAEEKGKLEEINRTINMLAIMQGEINEYESGE